MAKFNFKDFIRKAKNAPATNQRWALYSLGFLLILVIAWVGNFFL